MDKRGGVNMYKKCMIIFMVGLMLMGCSTANKSKESVSTENSIVISKDDFLNEMKEMFEQSDNTFSYEDVDKSILEGERVNITLNARENMQVYIYESSDKASEDAKRISLDGFSYTKSEGDDAITTKIDWIDNPHFYKIQNIIILYLGNDETILNMLLDSFGEQIAGF